MYYLTTRLQMQDQFERGGSKVYFSWIEIADSYMLITQLKICF